MKAKNFTKAIKLLIELMEESDLDSEKADKIRDKLDEHWYHLSDQQKETYGKVSAFCLRER